MERPSLVAVRLSALPDQLGRALKPRRLRTSLAWLAAALGLTAVFGSALVGAAALHVDEAPTRRLAAALTNAALATVFQGRLEIGAIERLSFDGARVGDVRVFDPEGHEVIRARGLEARVSTLRLLRTLLAPETSSSAIVVTVPRVHLEHASVTLLPDAAGIPSLARAFLPRSVGPADPTARPVVVSLPRIAIDQAEAQGDAGIPIDGEIRRAVASFYVRTDELVAVDVRDTGFVERGLLPVEIAGAGDYHLRVDLATERPEGPAFAMWADASSTVGALPVAGHVEIRNDKIEGALELPVVDAARIAALVPALPLERSLSGRVTFEGTFRRLLLGATAEVRQGAGIGTIQAEGALDLGGPLRLEVAAEATELDPRAFVATLPDTRVDARARARLTFFEGEPALSVDVATSATLADGHVVPAIDAVLALHRGELLASAWVHEAGLPVDGRFTVGPDGAVRFSVEGEAEALERVPRLSRAIQGAASARLDGRYDGDGLDAALLASATSLRVPGGAVAAGSASAHGRIHGRPEALSFEGEARALDVDLAGERWDDVRVDVRGPLLSPSVRAAVRDRERGAMDAAARVSVADRSASGVTFSVEREGVRAEGSAREVRFAGGDVRATGVRVAGDDLGSVRGDLAVVGDEVFGTMRADAVDLRRLAKLAGLPVDVDGLANVDVALTRTPTGRRGHVELEIEGGRVLVLDGLSSRISMRFDDRQVETAGFVRIVDRASEESRARASAAGLLGGADLCDGPVAELRFVQGRGALSGPLLRASTWTDALGSVSLQADDWNLACLHRKVPFFVNPLEEARGLLTTRVRLVREEAGVPPSFRDAFVRTRGLALAGKDEAWSTSRIDAQVRGELDGGTGEARAEIFLFDGTMLLEGDASATLDVRALADANRRARALVEAPFDVSLTMPRRSFAELDTLPSPLRELVPTLEGDVRVDVGLSGTRDAPYAYLSAEVFQLAARSLRGFAPPVDLRLVATYEADDEKLGADLGVIHEGLEVAKISGAVEVPVEELVALAPERWTGGLHAEFFDLPLGAIPTLADRDVSGFVSGVVAVSGLNQEPRLDVELDLPFLQLGEVFVDGTVVAHVTPRAAGESPTLDAGAIDAAAPVAGEGDGNLRIDLDGQDGGKLQLLAYAGVRWRDLTLPELALDRPGGLAATAEAFRLAAAYPLVSSVVSRLDGLLDGATALEWGSLSDGARGRVKSGAFDVTDAVVFIPQLGQELRGGRATIRSTTTETDAGPVTTVRADDLEAQGISGRVYGAARADLEGLALREAAATLLIDEGEELPVTVEGVPVGRASGRADLTLTPGAGVFELGVAIPAARIDLPESSTRNVQPLDDAPGVTVTTPLGPPAQERDPDALRWAVTVDVDDLHVVGAGADLHLATAQDAPIELLLSDRLHAKGDVLLDRGDIELNKKTFELERGLIRLRDEDTGNPYVNVTAHWDGSDGSRVYVDYVGLLKPITDEKIRFRSDPPRTQAEIVSLLLFGGDASSTATGNVVGSVGGTVATALVNDLLSQSMLSDLSVNLGSTDAGGFVQAELPISEAVSIDVSLAQQQRANTTGTATAGASATQTCQDLGFDYRISRRWSLRAWGGLCNAEQEDVRTSLGVDVVWQYSY